MGSLKGIYIPVKGNDRIVEYDPMSIEGATSLQQLVGGWIEVIPSAVAPEVHLVVNEDGLRLRLPPNPYASSFVHRGLMLVGDVVLVGIDANGFVDIPELVVRRFREAGALPGETSDQKI